MRAASLYVGGEWAAPSTGDAIDVISPHSEELIGRAPLDEFLDVKAISVAL
jgi:acyl-CoA reductase-like NAD-dependent aldehyde dehydrogenase